MRLHTQAWKRALIGVVAAVTISTTFFTGPAHADSPSSVSGDGTWSVEPVEGGGQRVTLRLNQPLPVRDAAPELAVDGRSIGPAEESVDGLTLTVTTADPSVATPSSVDVAWNGEVPSATSESGARPKASVPAQKPTGGKLPIDPATPGRYGVTHDEYDLGDTAVTLAGLGGLAGEIRAAVYLPKGAHGKR
jgi:hypothetical protein